MEPNPPINRFRHVLKTYKGSKSPWVVVDTGVVALYLTGQDDAGYKFRHMSRAFALYLTDSAGWPPSMRHGPRSDIEDLITFVAEAADDVEPWWPSQGYAQVDDWIRDEAPEAKEDHDLSGEPYLYPIGDKEYAQLSRMDTDYLVDLAWRIVDLFMAEKLPEQHPHDFLIPWIARELGRTSKQVWRGAPLQTYTEIESQFIAKGPAIAMWAEHENVDLSRTSASEALEAVKHFDAFSGEMPQGRVIYQFDDGWTVQKITEEEQLIAEGEAMQHCVGSYCIDRGDIEILSLRDKRGMPHVTMEWDVEKERFNQIRGKQNEMPVERYRPYLFKFIEKTYGGDPVGLMLAGKDPKEVDFSDQVIDEVDFSELAQEGMDFERVEFAGAVLIDCDLTNLNLYMANFNGATIKRCSFQNSELVYADFENAELEDVDFGDAKLYAASFIDATFTGVEFAGFSGVSDLREASFDNVIMHKAGEVAGMRLPFTSWSHSGAEGFEKMEGADFVNSELSREHIPTDSDAQALQYALGLARVANIDNTPLEDWIAEQAEASAE